MAQLTRQQIAYVEQIIGERKLRLRYCPQCRDMTDHVGRERWSLRDLLFLRQHTCYWCFWTYNDRKVGVRLRRAAYAADSHECVYCASTRDLGVDHVVPRSQGGQNTIENLVTACNPCNSRRKDGAQPPARFGRYRRR